MTDQTGEILLVRHDDPVTMTSNFLDNGKKAGWVAPEQLQALVHEPFGVVLYEGGDVALGQVGALHAVVAEPIGASLYRIFDPWPPGIGSSYVMEAAQLFDDAWYAMVIVRVG